MSSYATDETDVKDMGRLLTVMAGGSASDVWARIPAYAPIALMFWLVHVAFRFRAGGPVGVCDLALAALLFLPWSVRSRLLRVLMSAAAYFAVYYVAFLPLLDDIAARAHWHEIPALEAALFPGTNPVIAVQAYRTTFLNVIFCIGYTLHIANILVPLLFFLRTRDMANADSYSSSFLACGYLGFAIYLLYPVVPPRLALPEVTAVTPPWASDAWHTAGSWFRANPYAAMPSLHCAFPVLSYLYLRSIHSPLRWVFLGMSIWLFVGTVYLGEHYVSDVVAAMLVAWVAAESVRHMRRWSHDRS
ncbi:phosphatase PAP2 family protein [Candidatus Fermentibacteria bacterium]|nr:phosphatase PAP2 family protein [Candidatus Fermentibacteria bacterium]